MLKNVDPVVELSFEIVCQSFVFLSEWYRVDMSKVESFKRI